MSLVLFFLFLLISKIVSVDSAALGVVSWELLAEMTGISVIWSSERSTRLDLVGAVTEVEDVGAVFAFLEHWGRAMVTEELRAEGEHI